MGFHDPELTEHNHMRHLLQVGYVDREIGRLLRRLRRTRLLRRSLLVVTADHGYSFDVGVRSRRKVSATNIEEIAPVPFFVKAPGQMNREVDESLVRTTDIVPTVADLLGVRMGWRAAGRPASSEATKERTKVCLRARDFSGLFCIERDELARRRRAVRERRAAVFLTGAESRRRYGDPWAAVHRAGTHPELLGRRLSALPLERPGGPSVRLANAGLEQQVEPASELLPTRITGNLTGGAPGELRDLAVAVNGRIRGTGRSFRLRFRPGESFSFVVPDGRFGQGPTRSRCSRYEPAASSCRFSTPGRPSWAPRCCRAAPVRLAGRVDEHAEVAPAVVAGDARAEVVLPQPDRVGRLQIPDQLLVA